MAKIIPGYESAAENCRQVDYETSNNILMRRQIEQALDSGKLQVLWKSGNWNAVRRNGATRTWKTDPERFVIPCKSGLRDTFCIAMYSSDIQNKYGGHLLNSPYIRIKPE